MRGGGEVGSKLYLFSEYVENAALKDKHLTYI
jgi:hypothetical protein